MKRFILATLLFSVLSCKTDGTDPQFEAEKQNQIQQNQTVVDNLKANGEKFHEKRTVDHWIYFKDEEGKNNFLKAIAPENYKTVQDTYDENLGERPYKLHLSRIDYVDIKNVNKYTLHLWETALTYDGDYDGWETFIKNY